MQSHLGHILFNVQGENLGFYRDLTTFLGWQVIYDGAGMLGVGGPGELSLWFGSEVKPAPNDYDGPGINHLGFNVPSAADVDTAAAFLRERGVELLFETPRHRPEFAGDGTTYYQIMFETPDRLLLEVVYTGPHTG
jgi:catechol 2,3-dioxygenase-like lactoylglutathione lyase family enzyme